MSYHAENNGYSHIRHHAASFAMQRSAETGQIISKKEGVTLQDFYNAYAAFMGYALVWGTLAVVAYSYAKPYIQYMLGHDLL